MLSRFSRLAVALLASGVLLASMATGVFADPRDFDIVNNSSVVLTNIYIAPSSSDNWEEDTMGEDVLNPGDTVHMTFDGTGSECLYDIKAVGQQGQVGYLYKVNLCSVDTVTFSDSN